MNVENYNRMSKTYQEKIENNSSVKSNISKITEYEFEWLKKEPNNPDNYFVNFLKTWTSYKKFEDRKGQIRNNYKSP